MTKSIHRLSDVQAAQLKHRRAAGELEEAKDYARVYADSPQGHPALKAYAKRRLIAAREGFQRTSMRLAARLAAHGFRGERLRLYLAAERAADERVRAEQQAEFVESGRDQIARVRAYDAAHLVAVPGSAHVPQPDGVHAFMADRQRAVSQISERQAIEARERTQLAAARSAAVSRARRRPGRCARAPRSHHRTVARPTAGGDSGDDPPAEPPGPGNPHTAAIGGVL